MSASDQAVMARAQLLQERIDARQVGEQFDIEELIGDEEWKVMTRHNGKELALATSITNAFKRRMFGFPQGRGQVFANIQWTGKTKRGGRTAIFERIDGHHDPARVRER